MDAWVVWIVAACVLAVGEIATVSFFLGPFAAGAVVAALAALAGGGWVVSTIVFLVVSVLLLLFVRPVARRHLRHGPTLKTGPAALVGRLAPLLGPLLLDLLFTELRHQLDADAINADELAAGAPLPGARRISVAFADLVGFTSLGELVPPEELVQLAERLTVLARDVAVPPVRFIKTIGDAVMMVSTDPAPLIDSMLKLVEAAEIDPSFPRLRAGAATGDAVSRAGDWFGSPVNTASRVTDIARPGTVLVTEAVYGAVEAPYRFQWSWAGTRRLKGIAGVVGLYRVRHRPR